MFEEVVQQTTTTTGTLGTGQFDTSLVAFVALILGIVATALSILLTMLKIREHFTRRSKQILERLAPKLREMRSSLQKDGRTRDVLRTYSEEIDSKGYEVNLRKMGSSLPQLFGELGSRVEEIKHDTYQKTTIFFIMKEAFQLALDQNISADPEVRRIVGQICTEIDRIVEV